MIIKQDNIQEAKVIGDIENNKVGIDRANIDFIATLLTSNLYSKPFESFLRETVSNAYDAMVEAGTVETHKIIFHITEEKQRDHYYNDYVERFSIRDYGTGISPERFNTIYNKIGSSTKRDSNDYIGGLGIGKFAGLSCSDVVEITSYYEGVKYSYLMYKNGTGIQIDKISEEETTEHNGVEVSLVITTGYQYRYRQLEERNLAIRNMSFFENLHIIDETGKYLSVDFNERVVIDNGSWSFCNILDAEHTNYVKLGRVLYPASSYYPLHATKCVINIPIGEIMVTPNRETLMLTEEATELINDTILFANNSIMEISAAKLKETMKNEKWSMVKLHNLIANRSQNEIPVQLGEKPNTTIKIKSHQANLLLKEMGFNEGTIYLLTSVNLNGIYISKYFISKYITENEVWSGTNIREYSFGNLIGGARARTSHPLVVQTDVRMKNITRDYIRSKYRLGNCIVVSDFSLKKIVYKHCKLLFQRYSENVPISVMKHYARAILKEVKVLTVNDSIVPEDYKKESTVVEKKQKMGKHFHEIEVDEYKSFGCQCNYRKVSLAHCVNNAKHFNVKVIYTERKRDMPEEWYWLVTSLANYKGGGESNKYNFIAISAKDISWIEGKKNCFNYKELLEKPYKLIYKAVTARLMDRTAANIYSMNNVAFLSIKEKCYTINGYANKHGIGALSPSLSKYYEDRGWYDKTLINSLKYTEEELEYLNILSELQEHKNEIITALSVQKLSARKLIKIKGYRESKVNSKKLLSNI